MARAKIVACLTAAAVLAGCSKSRVTVASKNFTESVLLGEIVAQHIERRLREPVDRRLDLGGTLLGHQALVNGEIDVYPEYTGTALTAVLKLPPSSDEAAVFEKVRAQYRERWKIDWLDPLGFNNTFAMAIRGERARRRNIRSLSDAARDKAGWRLGGGYEFSQRPDGLGGLLKSYGLALRGPPVTMDLGLLYQALESGQVDMVAGNSTDGLLSVLDVRVLEDDKHYFPPYQAALVVREQTLRRNPRLRAALSELSGKFSDQLMRKLNYQVDGEHRRIADVAGDFLKSLAP